MAKVMDSMTEWMNKYIAPLAGRLGQVKALQAISQGMMSTMPLTIGVALVAIVINLPIPGFSDWLVTSGISACANELLDSTMSLMGIYVSFLIAYHYAQLDGMNGITAGVMSMASFLILIPSTIVLDAEAGTTMKAFPQTYLGSSGVFVAILLSIFVAWLYGFLTRKNIKLNLPESVPPMVADSMSPVFTAMIIFTGIFCIKYAFTFTPWGNAYDCVGQLISAPLVNVGSSPWSYILIYTVAAIVWFFGVHPSSIVSVFIPVMMVVGGENVAAYMNGEPIPHLMFALMYSIVYFGGTGNTIGLCLDMYTAKSEKFKAMRNLMTIPNLFNINEPVIFGVPVMLNPIFFIPMALSALVPGVIGILLCNILPVTYNATVSMPWAMPTFISAFFTGGPAYSLIIIVCMLSSCLLYYPFFKIADNQALEEERALAAAKAEQAA